MTGEELRALVDRAKAAKAAGNLTPEMESGIMGAVSAGIQNLQDQAANKPEAYAERLAAARSDLPNIGDPLRGGVIDEVAQDEALGMTPEQIGSKNAQALMHGVDIFSGAAPARLAVAKATGVYKPGEASQMLLGEGAPSGADIAERYTSLSGKPLTQAAVATGLDLIDPGLVVGAGELMTNSLRNAGKDLFAHGVRKIEEAGVKAGKLPGAVTETMLKYDIMGGGNARVAKADKVEELLTKRTNAVAEAADAAGAKVTGLSPQLEDLSKQLDSVISGKDELAANAASDIKTKLDAQIARIKNNPAKTVTETKTSGVLDATGQPVTSEVTREIPAKDNTPNVSETLKIKRSLRNNLSSNAYDTLARTNEGQKALKKISKIAQTESENTIGDVLGEDVKNQFKEDNADLGNLLTTDKKSFSEAAKENTRNPVTPVDTALAVLNPGAAASKKAGDILKSSAFQTRVGQALNKGAIAPRAIAYPAALAIKPVVKSVYRKLNGNN